MTASRAAELFARFGSDTVSGQALEPGIDYWFYGADACVGYQDTGGAWVAVGGPICEAMAQGEVMEAFACAAQKAGKRVRFFGIEDASTGWNSVSIGEQAEWNPTKWSAALASKASLREQLRRARAKSVRVRQIVKSEILDLQSPVHSQVCRMVRDWQKNQAMAPMSFLVQLDIFGNACHKHYFVAERDGCVVAILVAMQIPARKGWFFEDVLRAHDAPNGSIELLFDHAMRAAESDKIEVVSFGLAPLSGDVSKWLARVRDASQWLYDFDGLRAFKEKLLPTTWRPIYLSFPKHENGLRATIDSLTAFAGGSWIRFGVRTLVHAQPTLIWWLALLLIPWMVLLGAIPTDTWFPSPGIKYAWIAFDIFLFIGLVTLAIHWRRVPAALLALASACDASLGAYQLATYNQYQLDSLFDWFFSVFAVLAPMGASIILAVGALSRHKLYHPLQ